MTISRPAFGMLIVVLFVSLLANVFLGGLTVGKVAKPLPLPEIVALGPILKSLPEADRRAIRRSFADHHEEMQKDSQAARASAAALREALKADPYDADKVQQALADYRRDFHNLHDLEQTVFWDAAQHLSDQGRAQLADSAAFERSLK
jgi:uncharacterized membrane protein